MGVSKSTQFYIESAHLIKRARIQICIGFLIVPILLTACHPVSNPGSFTLTEVSHFPFYEKLGNPCGMSQGVPADPALPAPPADESAFSNDFLLAMGTAINLTIDALENLEKANQVQVSCGGIYLSSLPKTPALKTMNEFKLMGQTYKSAIYLTAHLHIVMVDRQIVDETNEVPDEDTRNEEDDDTGPDFLCGREPSNYVTLVQDLTQRMETLLCTVVTGANLEQRAAFRRPLQHLETTKIYRYHNSCSALQARDCVVIQETKQFLQKLRTKYKKLIFQRFHAHHVVTTSTTVGAHVYHSGDDSENQL